MNTHLNPAPFVAAGADGAPSSAATPTGMRSTAAAAATSSSWPCSVPRSSPFVAAAAAASVACDVVAIPSPSSFPRVRAVAGGGCPCPSTCCDHVSEYSDSKRWAECLQLVVQVAAVLAAVPCARACLVRTNCPRTEGPGHYSNRKAPIVGRCCKWSRRTLEGGVGD